MTDTTDTALSVDKKFIKLLLGLQVLQVFFLLGIITFLVYFLPDVMTEKVNQNIDENKNSIKDFFNEVSDDIVTEVSEKIELKLKILNQQFLLKVASLHAVSRVLTAYG